MRVSFVGQPFDEYGWTADWLNEALTHESAGMLQIAVAWAKRSGLLRLQDSLRTFRDHGGTVSAIIGIDEGGATCCFPTVACRIVASGLCYGGPLHRNISTASRLSLTRLG
jgi:hypothetical protein